MASILDGIRVLDFSRYIAGAHCAKLLADMGADVVRIDDPGGSDDRFQPPFGPNREPLQVIALNCNKRGITLNLRAPEGREVFRKLIDWADIIIENFSLPAKKSFGFIYEDLKAINPRVIHLSFSGYGSTGPYKDYLAFDSIVQGEMGITYATGYPGGPPARAGTSVIDLAAGINGALAAVLALYRRRETGEGQMAELSLIDLAAAMVTAYGMVPAYEVGGEIREPLGLGAYGCWANGFKSKDGLWVYISTLSQGIWKRFLGVIGRMDLFTDPRFKDDYERFVNRDALDPIVEPWVRARNAEDILKQLHEARVPCGHINNSSQIARHAQVQARNMIINMPYPGIEKFPYPGVSIKFSESPGQVRRRAPETGEHNQEFYSQELKYTPEQIARLKQTGVI